MADDEEDMDYLAEDPIFGENMDYLADEPPPPRIPETGMPRFLQDIETQPRAELVLPTTNIVSNTTRVNYGATGDTGTPDKTTGPMFMRFRDPGTGEVSTRNVVGEEPSGRPRLSSLETYTEPGRPPTQRVVGHQYASDEPAGRFARFLAEGAGVETGNVGANMRVSEAPLIGRMGAVPGMLPVISEARAALRGTDADAETRQLQQEQRRAQEQDPSGYGFGQMTEYAAEAGAGAGLPAMAASRLIPGTGAARAIPRFAVGGAVAGLQSAATEAVRALSMAEPGSEAEAARRAAMLAGPVAATIGGIGSAVAGAGAANAALRTREAGRLGERAALSELRATTGGSRIPIETMRRLAGPRSLAAQRAGRSRSEDIVDTLRSYGVRSTDDLLAAEGRAVDAMDGAVAEAHVAAMANPARRDFRVNGHAIASSMEQMAERAERLHRPETAAFLRESALRWRYSQLRSYGAGLTLREMWDLRKAAGEQLARRHPDGTLMYGQLAGDQVYRLISSHMTRAARNIDRATGSSVERAWSEGNRLFRSTVDLNRAARAAGIQSATNRQIPITSYLAFGATGTGSLQGAVASSIGNALLKNIEHGVAARVLRVRQAMMRGAPQIARATDVGAQQAGRSVASQHFVDSETDDAYRRAISRFPFLMGGQPSAAGRSE